MKIVYIAKHGSGGNDDEGAVSCALRELGHEIVLVQETHAHIAGSVERADLALCHHLQNIGPVRRLRCAKACWCFDLIDWPEPVKRHNERRAWAEAMEDAVDVMFCTDGGWARGGGKREWLMQGSDGRGVPRGLTALRPAPCDVLYVGGLGYGRSEFVEAMSKELPGFRHVRGGCFGADLAAQVSSAKIVVCPPAPVSDWYWSNRVWNMCRLAACVLHPRCAGLDYVDGKEIAMYDNVDHMLALIADLMKSPARREVMGRNAQAATRDRHTYKHRCEVLLKRVFQRGL